MATNDAFISVILFIATLIIVPNCSASLVNDCDGNPVEIGVPSGSISLNGTLKANNVSCVWSLNSTSTSPLSLSLGGKETIRLHPNDTLEIMDEKGVVSVNLTGLDLKKWGVILSMVTDKGSIRLNISAEEGDRTFHAAFDRTGVTAFNYNEPHDYFIPINHVPSGQNAVLKSHVVSFDLNPSLNPDKFLLLNYRQIVGKPTLSVEGSTAVTSSDKEPLFDLLNDVIDTKTSKPVPLKITLTNYEFANTRLVLGTELVDSKCSGVKTLDSKTDLTAPANPPVGSSLNCLWLVRSDKSLRIEYPQTHQLYGDDDVAVVVDGPRLLKNKILCELNKENLDDSQHSYDHSVSSQNRLRVSFVSKYVTDTTGLFNLHVSRATKSQVNPSGVVDITGDSDEPNPLFMFSASKGQKAVLNVQSKNVAGTNLMFYSSDEKDEVPFLTVYKGDGIPKRIVSPSSFLRVTTSDGLASGVQGQFTSEPTLDTTAVGDTSSFVLTNVSKDTAVSWLLPRRLTPGSLHLNIPRLILSNDPANCVELSKLTNEWSSIFKACYNPKLTAVATRSLPRILLNSVNSYVLSYSTGSVAPSVTGTPLIEASVTYVDDKCGPVNVTLPDVGTTIVAPESYPNNFRLNEASVDGICHSWLYNKKGSFIHVVMDDVDLLGDQLLILQGPGTTVTLDKNAQVPKLPDLVIANSTLITVNSSLKANYDDLNGISGRGFRFNISSTTCGGMIDGDKSVNITTTDYPAALSTNVTKCVWILSTKAKSNAILNITSSFAKDGSDGSLVIYDNLNTRQNRYNESYVFNGTFTTSVPSTVIVYTSKDPSKPMKGLVLTWKVDTCDNLYNKTSRLVCQNDPSRCLLPTWICNGYNDCGDNSDEIHCNTTIPTPPPPPPSKPCSSGVNGWVIVLVIIPMAIAVGILITKFGPIIMARFSERRGRYAEFNDFAEVS